MTRSLWRPPQLRIGESSEGERHATWLELFYDLVFVVAISQLAHNLADDVSLSGFFGFVVLFVPVWWAWIGTTLYSNRFDSDDLGHRLLTGLQMMAIAALAINVHHGLGESSAGFALSYAAVRGLLVVTYVRAIRAVPLARPLTRHYAIGFAIAAGFWLISAFVPLPLRFFFWTIGLIVDFATPLSMLNLQAKLPPHQSHLPERMGLFTLIVLGESIIAVVDGVAEQKWQIQSAISAIFGLSIAFSFWWLYFENVTGASIRDATAEGRIRTMQVWFYGHLPLVIGITATGVGVEKVVSSDPTLALPDNVRWLLCGSVALCFLSLGILHLTRVIRYCKIRARYRTAAATLLALALAFGGGLLPLSLISLVALVCAIQFGLELYLVTH